MAVVREEGGEGTVTERVGGTPVIFAPGANAPLPPPPPSYGTVSDHGACPGLGQPPFLSRLEGRAPQIISALVHKLQGHLCQQGNFKSLET